MSIAIEENRSATLSIASRSEKRAIAGLLAEAGTIEAKEIAQELSDLSLLGAYKDILSTLQATDTPLKLLRASSKAIHAYRMVQVINESSIKATTVVTALRSYLHPTETAAAIVDVHQEIGKALTLLQNSIKYGIDVQTDFVPGDLFVRVDKLDQVLINIIRNAVQSMDFKGTLILRTRADEARVVVSIIDSGTGIPPELREEIFKPFFTTRANGEGMGLGLDICRRLLEKHDGRLSFESEPGHTEFHIDMPRGVQ
jgi:signal transduction histidine kinase